MFEISEEFRKLLHDVLSKYSVGNVSFGVLKTFYDDEHVLYDEIIDELPKDHMPLIETALKQDGIYVFMMHIVEAAGAFNNMKPVRYVDTAFWFDRHVSQIVFDKLMEKSRLKTCSENTEGIPSMRFLNKEEYDEYMSKRRSNNENNIIKRTPNR